MLLVYLSKSHFGLMSQGGLPEEWSLVTGLPVLHSCWSLTVQFPEVVLFLVVIRTFLYGILPITAAVNADDRRSKNFHDFLYRLKEYQITVFLTSN